MKWKIVPAEQETGWYISLGTLTCDPKYSETEVPLLIDFVKDAIAAAPPYVVTPEDVGYVLSYLVAREDSDGPRITAMSVRGALEGLIRRGLGGEP